VSIYIDNTTTASKRQTDSARIYRDDDAYPVKDPTTSGYGVDVNWQNVVYVQNVGGSALTAGESAMLMTTLPGKVDTVDTVADAVKAKTDQLTFTKSNELDVNLQSVDGTTVTGSGTEVDPWGP
jgi:hypothetical protein